ncbi:MAG: DUF1343 domain-containing protein [Bacteroidetes bacterium]|nr:DUF1343 domain-containing protein [Bacteroidota bacterium]MBU1114501.1 DUF1343 domain-containing protein [Bacteroidota bacterium]MBU1799295.1 DUF1343 domain-containing protein [Bacteroidota bacterium]
MRKTSFSKIVLFAFIIGNYALQIDLFAQQVKVKVGADVLVSDNLNLIQNKRIGIVTNHSAVLSNGTHLVDTLTTLANVKVTTLFGPEHGIRGNAPDGNTISDGIDSKTKLPVYSLYGKIRKPTKEMLQNVDILIFDIQDIGARFYTFISTLYYTLEAAAENNIPIIVLDRPNPINGITVDGPIRTEEFKSFVAIAQIPIQHGMTIGELANMFNNEKWLENEVKADLTVIKMKDWKREYLFSDCNLPWVVPSPNIPDLETAIIYPGMCLLEGVNVSEGRGTYAPFLTIGAPFINSNEVLAELKKLNISGIDIKPITFTPKSIENMSTSPKYKDIECYGLSLKITDSKNIMALRFGIELLYSIHKLYPNNFEFRNNWLDKLFGNTNLTEMLKNNSTPEEIFNTWENELSNFKTLREKYLLY